MSIKVSAMDFINEISGLQISPVTAASTLLVLFIGIVYYALKDRRLLPGPRGLPYLGYWPLLDDKTAHIQLTELMKKYGDVYSFTITGQLYIHLGSIKAARETLISKADCFTARKSGFNTLNLLMREGVACLNGEPWKVLRKFFVQAFREFGLTSVKDYMTGPIYDSMSEAVDKIKAADGKPFNITKIITIQCSGLMRRTLFSDVLEDDEELENILEDYGRLINIFSGPRILLQGEFARRFIFPRLPYSNVAQKSRKTTVRNLLKIIKRHKETFNEDNIRDLVDNYINERRSRQAKNDPTAEFFTDMALVDSLIQIVGDGILGLAIFVSYFFYGLLEHPEEQDKIFNELEEVIGPDRQPTLEDKNKLIYTNAFMQEVLRFSDFFTLFPSVECTKETTINDYTIPKGAVAMINFWACHRDPNIFTDPAEFRPSRYISEPGKQKSELPISFGIGKRSCVGESYAMTQSFLILVTVLKNFQLCFPEGYNKKSFIDGNMEIYAVPRKIDAF